MCFNKVFFPFMMNKYGKREVNHQTSTIYRTNKGEFNLSSKKYIISEEFSILTKKRWLMYEKFSHNKISPPFKVDNPLHGIYLRRKLRTFYKLSKVQNFYLPLFLQSIPAKQRLIIDKLIKYKKINT